MEQSMYVSMGAFLAAGIYVLAEDDGTRYIC